MEYNEGTGGGDGVLVRAEERKQTRINTGGCSLKR